MPTIIKSCPRCRLDKPFYVRKNGYTCSYCVDCSKELYRIWYAGSELAKKQALAQSSAWRQNNRDRQNASCRKYYLNHKTEHTVLVQQYRSRLNQAEGTFTVEEWNQIVQGQNGLCASCREPKKLTVDHIIPLSKGGRHEAGNIQGLCKPCNSKKGNRIVVQESAVMAATV